jgi:hypothetical protein
MIRTNEQTGVGIIAAFPDREWVERALRRLHDDGFDMREAGRRRTSCHPPMMPTGVRRVSEIRRITCGLRYLMRHRITVTFAQECVVVVGSKHPGSLFAARCLTRPEPLEPLGRRRLKQCSLGLAVVLRMDKTISGGRHHDGRAI